MNPRIKQLAEQARINVSQKNYGYYWIESADGIEKFAEIADTAEPYQSNDLIKQHFGVEE